MRSFCRRSIDDDVDVSDALAHVVVDVHAHLATSLGTSVFGPTTRISGQPSVVSAWMCERATRECSDVADDRHA